MKLFLTACILWGGLAVSLAADLKAPVGIQLYSLRDHFTKGVPATLDKVKGYGITQVELAGTYNLPVKDFKALLDKHGLQAPSGHFPFEKLRDHTEQVAAEAKALGLKYVGCAWAPHQGEFDERQAREISAAFNKIGEALSKHGLKFFYHPHGFEFRPLGSGTVFDLMIKETRPEFVSFEMDTFWVYLPGHDPAQLLEKYGDRWKLMHVKDMKKGVLRGGHSGQSDVRNDVVVGTGQLDWPAILKAAQKAGIEYYFLEDESPDAPQQLSKSLQFLKTLK